MSNTDENKIDEILERGVDEIIKKESLEKRLKSGKKLRVKFGIDPTSPDLHLGHSIPLKKLRQFQNLGHKIIFLIGDFTAMIGDPSGRTEQRKMLTKKQVKENMKDYIKQSGKILDIKKVEIRRNSEWYEKMGALFFMQLASRFTYARIIERDDFKRRIKEDIDISMLELIYPLLQGYDSVELKADVEIGGRDQKFNLLMGRKVQKRYGQEEQDVMTLPLLEGIDGVRKMSKSYGNYIGLTEIPASIYGKIMSLPDEIIWKYLNLLTDISSAEIEDIKNKIREKVLTPKDAKSVLAKEIIRNYHSEKDAEKAAVEFEKVFKENKNPENISEFGISGSVDILDLLVRTNIASSKSDARRLIEQKGVKIDNEIQTDWQKKVEVKSGMIIQAGKRRFAKIKKA